jgi:hypothetical protein
MGCTTYALAAGNTECAAGGLCFMLAQAATATAQEHLLWTGNLYLFFLSLVLCSLGSISLLIKWHRLFFLWGLEGLAQEITIIWVYNCCGME